MENMRFSDDFLDNAYKVLAVSSCDSETELLTFKLVCRLCQKHGVSVRKYMQITNELDRALLTGEETTDADD